MAAVPACLSSPQMGAVTTLLGKVEGMDKAAKVGMNLSKVISTLSDDAETVRSGSRLAKTFADGRSVMRMGQWVKSSISVQQALDALRDAPPGTRADRMLKVVRHTADMGYKVGDNTSFLAKQGLVEANATAWETAAKRLQFLMYSLDATQAARALAALPPAQAAQQTRQQLTLLRCVLDCMMVLQKTRFVSAYDTVPAWLPPACGLASATTSKWKHGPSLWTAFTGWLKALKWASPGQETGISYMELAVAFELETGCKLPPVKNRFYAPPPEVPKNKPTTARDTLPDEEAEDGIAVYFDGGARGNGTAFAVAGAGAVLYRNGKKEAEIVLPLPNVRTNNVAEYEGLLASLELLQQVRVEREVRCVVRGDSALAVGQVTRRTSCSEQLRPMLTRASTRISAIQQRLQVAVEHVRRERNRDADALSNAAMDVVQRSRPPRQEQMLLLRQLQKSLLGKALSLIELGSSYTKVTKRPWHFGFDTPTTILTSLGGTIVRGVSCRAQITRAAEDVILGKELEGKPHGARLDPRRRRARADEKSRNLCARDAADSAHVQKPNTADLMD
ncbi:putative glycosomal membrane protein [Diplonema papillatum]|nr:putative glycosomal membrane protein [Diplonema papillatum]